MKIGLKSILEIVREKHSLRRMVVQSCVPTSYVKLNFATGECRVKLKGMQFLCADTSGIWELISLCLRF